MAVHDDNFVDTDVRWYQFRVKDSSASSAPGLTVKEDDALLFDLQVDIAGNGKLDITVFRASSYESYSFRLEAKGTAAAITRWNNWDITINDGWHGTAAAATLGGTDRARIGCETGEGAVYVRAKFPNYKNIAKEVDFYPTPGGASDWYPSDPRPNQNSIKYSGWVQVCGGDQ